jgi:hypothetical protein
MVHMLRKTTAIDQDIVEKNQNKSTKKRLKEVIQKPLECGRGVCQPKGHYEKLVMALMRPKSGLRYILRTNSDLMIAGAQVQIRKNSSPKQFVK